MQTQAQEHRAPIACTPRDSSHVTKNKVRLHLPESRLPDCRQLCTSSSFRQSNMGVAVGAKPLDPVVRPETKPSLESGCSLKICHSTSLTSVLCTDVGGSLELRNVHLPGAAMQHEFSFCRNKECVARFRQCFPRQHVRQTRSTFSMSNAMEETPPRNASALTFLKTSLFSRILDLEDGPQVFRFSFPGSSVVGSTKRTRGRR